MTEQELKEMWRRKSMHEEVFAHAILTAGVTLSAWNGQDPNDRKNFEEYTVPAGSKVLITMFSRFVDVGIRGREVEEIRHGYDARVDPCLLSQIKFL